MLIMEEDDWHLLPDFIWEDVLSFLDGKSLLSASEACRRFEEISVYSSKIGEKVRIVLNADGKIKTQLQALATSNRVYKNLKIQVPESSRTNKKNVVGPAELREIEAMFSETVTNLKLSNLDLNSEVLKNLLVSIKNLKVCWLDRINSRHNDYIRNFNTMSSDVLQKLALDIADLQELSLVRTDFLCFYFFQNCVKLSKLEIDGLFMDLINVEHLETFIVNLNDLKELRLSKFSDNFIFATGLLDNPPFQLDKLSISSVYWEDKISGNNFFTSQISLKNIELCLENPRFLPYDQMEWFNEILMHLFWNNVDLTNVTVTTHGYNIECCEFMDGIVCLNVRSLKYFKGLKDKTSALMEAFIKMFPDITFFRYDSFRINHIDENDLVLISSWAQLETFEVGLRKLKALKKIHVTSKHLTNLVISTVHSTEMSHEGLREFLLRHPTIRHFTITGCYSYQTFKLNEDFCGIVADCLPNLETFTIQGIKIKPKAVKLLCFKLKYLKRISHKNFQSDYYYHNQMRMICKKHNVCFSTQ